MTIGEDSAQPVSSLVLDLAPGTVIDGHYEIVALIARGGMSVVYKAKHLVMQRTAAIKVLQSRGLQNPEAAERFRREARTAARLTHPNIIELFGFGHIGEQPYIAMEFLEGLSLAEVLNNAPEHRLARESAVPIFTQICDALAYAHSEGVVHRDVKPSNVMVHGDSVKLLDFGIARSSTSKAELQTLTRAGEIFGSLPYISPEQFDGTTADTRSDIYSLGCLIYETLTGSTPFQAATPFALVLKHAECKPRRPKELSGDFGAVVLSTLEKNPDKRPQSVLDLKSELLDPPRERSKFRAKPRPSWKVWVASLTMLLVASAFIECLVVDMHHRKLRQDFARRMKQAKALEFAAEKLGKDAFKKVALEYAAAAQDVEALPDNLDDYRLALAHQAYALLRSANDPQAFVIAKKAYELALKEGADTDKSKMALALALQTLVMSSESQSKWALTCEYGKEYLAKFGSTAWDFDKYWVLVNTGMAYFMIDDRKQALMLLNESLRSGDHGRLVFCRSRLDLACCYLEPKTFETTWEEKQQGASILRDLMAMPAPVDTRIQQIQKEAGVLYKRYADLGLIKD